MYRRLPLAGLILVYGAIVLSCLTLRPLWLDEVLQLSGTTMRSFADMVRWIPTNPGAAPLGYFTQRPMILAFGSSPWWWRFPGLVFSLRCCGALLGVCP